MTVLHTKHGAKQFLVHRLIASAYLLNEKTLPQINHKNGIKTDNRIENLEWCTNQENRNHAVQMGLIAKGNKNGASLLTTKEVQKIKRMLKRKVSQKQIGEMFGVCQSAISLIYTGKNWEHI